MRLISLWLSQLSKKANITVQQLLDSYDTKRQRHIYNCELQDVKVIVNKVGLYSLSLRLFHSKDTVAFLWDRVCLVLDTHPAAIEPVVKHYKDFVDMYFDLPESVIRGCHYHYQIKADQKLIVSGRYVDNMLAFTRHEEFKKAQLIKNRQSSSDYPLAVVIPVYSGLEITLDCINSVLYSFDHVIKKILLVYDCGPEVRLLNAMKQAIQGHPKCELIINEENLGYVKSVNRAMAQVPDHDVILLNTDTVVDDYWADRLRDAAYRSSNIATVTPFSNNATIASFPSICEANAFPDKQALRKINQALRKANAGHSIDIPTAHGFCMYIRRQALREIGYFDEDLWGRGYGEENDFSIKANRKGYRNILAADVYVAHIGAASFSESSEKLVKEHLHILNRLYRDYDYRIHHFIVQDPLADARNRAALELINTNDDEILRKQPDRILMITHALGGGTAHHVSQLSKALIDEGKEVFVLKPTVRYRWHLEALNAEVSLFIHEADYGTFSKLLLAMKISYIHVHHLLGYHKAILEWIPLLGIPYVVTLHDYYSVCPRITMTNENNEYCGLERSESCNQCVKSLPNIPDDRMLDESEDTVEPWREDWYRFLNQAQRVIAPSFAAAKSVNAFLPLDNLNIKPHAERIESILEVCELSEKLYVAVPGAIGKVKGFNVLYQTARFALAERIPIHFVVVGYTCDDPRLLKLSNVSITGVYTSETFRDLVKAHHCQVAAIFSVWPETYSYTLTEVWQAGLPVVAFDIGAPAERIHAQKGGMVIPLTSPPEVICNSLIALSKMFKKTTISVDQPSVPLSEFYYGDCLRDTNLNNTRSQLSKGTNDYPIRLPSRHLLLNQRVRKTMQRSNRLKRKWRKLKRDPLKFFSDSLVVKRLIG